MRVRMMVGSLDEVRVLGMGGNRKRKSGAEEGAVVKVLFNDKDRR